MRPAAEFVLPPGTRSEWVVALVGHLFVRYPVPRFMYRAMLSEEGLHLVFPHGRHPVGRKRPLDREAEHRRWFQVVARGDSFADVAKRSLSRREAHWFLQAPAHHSIESSLLWAKIVAVGVPPEECERLLRRICPTTLAKAGDRLPDFLRLYVRMWPETEPRERTDLLDFLRHTLSDSTFSYSGRTLGSLRRQCEAWHTSSFGAHDGESRSWEGAFPAWEDRSEDGTVVRAVELITSNALAQEGGIQRHCVASYAHVCAEGACRIASLRRYRASETGRLVESDRLTVEIDPARKAVVQIRGRSNRRAAADEMATLRRWAGHHGLKIDRETVED